MWRRKILRILRCAAGLGCALVAGLKCCGHCGVCGCGQRMDAVDGKGHPRVPVRGATVGRRRVNWKHGLSMPCVSTRTQHAAVVCELRCELSPSASIFISQCSGQPETRWSCGVPLQATDLELSVALSFPLLWHPADARCVDSLLHMEHCRPCCAEQHLSIDQQAPYGSLSPQLQGQQLSADLQVLSGQALIGCTALVNRWKYFLIHSAKTFHAGDQI